MLTQRACMAKVDEYQPMLLDERPLALDETGWIYELKMDGYRVLAEFDGKVQLRTRATAQTRRSGFLRSLTVWPS